MSLAEQNTITSGQDRIQHRLEGDLSHIVDRVSATASRLQDCADDLFGPIPTAIGDGDTKPPHPEGHVGRMFSLLESLNTALDRLDNHAQRLRDY